MLRLDGRGPIHRQLYTALRAAMLSGEFAAGSRLPSTRGLAEEMGLSRTTTQLAYEQLLAEGYLEGRRGSGTYVAATGFDQAGSNPGVPLVKATTAPRWSTTGRRVVERAGPLLSSLRGRRPRPHYDFRHGLPPLGDFPHEHWRRLLGRQVRRATFAAFDYGPAQGSAALRDAIAAYLNRSRALACSAAQIVIVNGSQQGLDLIARLLLDAGDTVLMEEPGYEGARNAFVLAGARLIAVPVDEDGINLDAAPRRGDRARLAYVTPSHQYPMGSILSLTRRLALLGWAERVGAYIIEDDYDGEFRLSGRPLAPLAALDQRGRVIYLGTFSKVMFPALRLGYLVLPENLVGVFAKTKALADGGTSVLEQETLAAFITSGNFERHLRRARARMRERRAVLLSAIAAQLGAQAEVIGTHAGLHVLLRLRGWSQPRGETLIRRAVAAGVGLYSATPYYLTPPPQAEFVLGYAALSPAEIRSGIRRLGAIIAGQD